LQGAKEKPGREGRVLKSDREVRSVANLYAAEMPAVTVPEAFADHSARRRLFDIDRRRSRITGAARGNPATAATARRAEIVLFIFVDSPEVSVRSERSVIDDFTLQL